MTAGWARYATTGTAAQPRVSSLFCHASACHIRLHKCVLMLMSPKRTKSDQLFPPTP